MVEQVLVGGFIAINNHRSVVSNMATNARPFTSGCCCTAQHQGLRHMRPIALAGASGGLAGAVLSSVHQAFEPQFGSVPFAPPELCIPRTTGFELELLGQTWEIKSLIVGVLVGIILGPVIECLALVRQLLVLYLRYLLSSTAAKSKPKWRAPLCRLSWTACAVLSRAPRCSCGPVGTFHHWGVGTCY